MKKGNENQKLVNELVKLYFEYNPQINRGIAFKAKANDIISSYINIQKKSYDEIKACIEFTPMCQYPIWEQFSRYFMPKYKPKPKSNYKASIEDSVDPKKWI